MNDYSLVIGVDAKTLPYLKAVLPTWAKNKPSLLQRPIVVFFDALQASPSEILQTFIDAGIPSGRVRLVVWPPSGVEYPRDGLTKWTNPQRCKMLAGFCYMSQYIYVETEYWLKVDLDVIAAGEDNWVDPAWFLDDPVIVAPGWGYTKPPDTIQKLDVWAEKWTGFHCTAFMDPFIGTEPLNLIPEPGADAVVHKRICSWCAFFKTSFTEQCARMAEQTCGYGQIPVDSQDTFHWYVAARTSQKITTVNMKKHGWVLRGTWNGLQGALKELGFSHV